VPLADPDDDSRSVTDGPPFLDETDRVRAAEARGRGAMALIVNPNGVVLHLRDDKPAIPHPGRWSLFGGAVETGETPDQTVIRELREELQLDSVRIRALWQAIDHAGDLRHLTIYEAITSVPASHMVLREGQAVREFTITAALGLSLAPFCRRTLEKYAATHPGWR
jgi:8-oxo-dGTP diphosphatase